MRKIYAIAMRLVRFCETRRILAQLNELPDARDVCGGGGKHRRCPSTSNPGHQCLVKNVARTSSSLKTALLLALWRLYELVAWFDNVLESAGM